MRQFELDEERRRAARAYAEWHLGDATWADLILHAYAHPEATMVDLREEKESDD